MGTDDLSGADREVSLPHVAHGSQRHLGLTLLLLALGAALSIVWYAVIASPFPPQATPGFRESSRVEQWAVVASFFGVKTIYTILTGILIYALRASRAADLVALRWSLIAFFIGEAFCFVNVMFFHDVSIPLEHLHSLGMVVSIGFGAYALLDGIDSRIIHYSDSSRCACAGLCDGCAKHADVPCGLRRMFMLMLPLMALVAAIPLFSSFRDAAYSTQVLGANHIYRHPVVHQVYELRYLPLAGIGLLVASLLTLCLFERRAVPISKALAAAAIGALGFSFFRLLLVSSYIDNLVWSDVWEENLELLTIVAIAGILYLFRARLFATQSIEGGIDVAGSVART